MDPIGPQKLKKVDKKGEHKQLLGEGGDSWESNAPKDLGGGFNKRSGTHPAHEGKVESRWQGKVKGDTVHTFGVKGKRSTYYK